MLDHFQLVAGETGDVAVAAQYPDIGMPTYNTGAATGRIKDDSVVGCTVPPPVWLRDIATDDVYVAFKLSLIHI